MSWLGKVRHFSPVGDPALGDPDGTRMDLDTMLLLDAMREEAGIPFIVTDGHRADARQADLMASGLSDPKQSKFAHPRGEAVDGYFEGLSLLTMFSIAVRWPFRGVGLYPWTSTNQPILHLDVMDRGKPRTALWIRNRVGLYVYAPGGDFIAEFHLLISEERSRRA